MKTNEEKIEKLRKKQASLKNKYASVILAKLRKDAKFKSISNVATMTVEDKNYKHVDYRTLALALFYNKFGNVKYILLTRDRDKNIRVLHSDLARESVDRFLSITNEDLQNFFSINEKINNTINDMTLNQSPKKPRL